jgi:hypothetical protein
MESTEYIYYFPKVQKIYELVKKGSIEIYWLYQQL